MKKVILICACLLVFVSCEKPSDCFKSAGATTSRVYDGFSFHTILVNRGISLVIAQGDGYKVDVRAGENLIGDISVRVENGVLTLEDQTTCNWVRDYGQTVVYVTAPDLNAIYAKTELSVVSSGVLRYENLRIVSMDSYDNYTGTGTGDFYLSLDTQNLKVENNTVSRFYLSGQTQNLDLAVYESGGIFYGQELVAQHAKVYHRGTNSLYVHPVLSLTGDIYNIGNVISVVRPQQIDVTGHYHGRLIVLE